MTVNIDNVIRTFGYPHPPEEITQQPFDYESDHYARLCGFEGRIPYVADFVDYAYDLAYMDLQPDLLRYVLPMCLKAWQSYVYRHEDGVAYGRFVEIFESALVKRRGFRDLLSEAQYSAVAAFMGDTILETIDRERQIAFLDRCPSQAWPDPLVTFGAVFPTVADVCERWWQADTTGRACSVLWLAHYLTRTPVVWRHPLDFGDGSAWLADNIDFLNRTLNAPYLLSAVLRAAVTLAPRLNEALLQRIVSQVEGATDQLKEEIRALPHRLVQPDWSEWY